MEEPKKKKPPSTRWKGKPTKAHLKKLEQKAKENGSLGITKNGYSGFTPVSEKQVEHMANLDKWPRDPETGLLLPKPETVELTRKVLRLRAVHRKSYKEIAQECEVTERKVILILERELKRMGALPTQQRERLRQLELIALDNDERRLEEIASGEYGAVTPDERTRAISAKKGIRERRAKLAGLDQQSALTPVAEALKQLQSRRPNLKGNRPKMLESEDDFVDASFDVTSKEPLAEHLTPFEG